jgi:hypothetical protein
MKIILHNGIKMAKTIKLDFDGYYREEGLPPVDHNSAGVYAVYAGAHTLKGRCELRKLLYVGRSNDAADRPGVSHHKYEGWHSQLGKDDILYFSFADTNNEKRAEAALIYKFKPVCNDTGKDGFHYPKTAIETSGSNALMDKIFTVHNTD